jgi:hypothetical protein
MKRLLFAILLIIPALSFSAQLEDLVPAYAQKLLRGEVITETQLKSPQPILIPLFPGLKQFINKAITGLDPNLCVETLHLYKKPVSQAHWSDNQRLQVCNQLFALSTLTGIEYYSASRKAMRTFYESSVVIDGPKNGKVVSDPVFTQPPIASSLYARQKDLTFGENIYRYDYQSEKEAFFFMQENLTALNVGIITAVGKNKLRSAMAVIDCGDYLLVYAVSLAKASTVLGMGDRIGNSFGNRADAVCKWFFTKADRIFGR